MIQKQTEKNPLIDEFKAYLKQNKLKIVSAKSYMTASAIRVVNAHEETGEQNEYYINQYFESKEDKNWGQNVLPGFIQYLMGKVEHKKIISYINSRLPTEDKYGNNYAQYTEPLFSTLAKNQELLYGFIARKSFLNKHFYDIPKIIKFLELPRLKEALFAEMVEFKEFNTVKSQNLFLSLINEHSKDAKKYYSLLDKLNLNPEKSTKPLLSAKEKKAVVLNFDLLELNNYSQNKYSDLRELKQICHNFMLRIMENKELLGIDFYQTSESNQNKNINSKQKEEESWNITIVGEHPNLKIINQLFSEFVDKAFSYKNAYETSGVRIEPDYVQSIVEKDRLEGSIEFNETKKYKNKI